jgi:mono/diheme cytochrome c family protein
MTPLSIKKMSDNFRDLILAVLFISFGNFVCAAEPPMRDNSRGELLYSTHCLSCHSDQIHWRKSKHANDWASLKSEVNRWQGVLSLKWSNEDIENVARYLNVLYYHYPTSDLLVHTD